MNILNNINIRQLPLRKLIKHYQIKIKDIQEHLLQKPSEWGKFQNEFNSEVNTIFRETLNFEKENMKAGNEERIYKLKRLFMDKIRPLFENGELTEWIRRKPYGYAGDFKIIDDIYQNQPQTTGFARLFDNYVQMSAISVAVRNRKDDFKKKIANFVKCRQGQALQIMNLASGPCREIKELLYDKDLFKNIQFDCYDHDEHALQFATESLAQHNDQIKWIRGNAAKMAFRKDIIALINKKYDLIYSTGLFDYFEEKISTKLITNLRKLLKPEGILVISNVRDKYSNPSVHYMEWVGEWELVYCEDENFREFFINAGFSKNDLDFDYEQQGIMQYVTAVNNSKE